MQGWPAAHGTKPLADIRLVHNAQNRHAILRQRDERAPARHAGNKGARAINRIDDPAKIIAGTGRLFVVKLFAQNAMLGKLLADKRANGGLGIAVGMGDRVEPVFAQLVVNFLRGAKQRHGFLCGGIGKPMGES